MMPTSCQDDAGGGNFSRRDIGHTNFRNATLDVQNATLSGFFAWLNWTAIALALTGLTIALLAILTSAEIEEDTSDAELEPQRPRLWSSVTTPLRMPGSHFR